MDARLGCCLQESALIETFNLKAAVELHMGNVGGAQAALQDMPPRAESELDPVSPSEPASRISLCYGHLTPVTAQRYSHL